MTSIAMRVEPELSSCEVDATGSKKLYGRNKEISKILGAYKEMRNTRKGTAIFIHGPSGVGKSALARTLEGQVLEDGGFFVAGKFGLMQHIKQPYAAFVSAFSALVDAILARGSTVSKTTGEAIRMEIGEGTQVLADLIPNLHALLGSQQEEHQRRPQQQAEFPDENIHLGRDRIARFQDLLRGFVRTVTSTQAPLVILLDDLHWADAASLQLLQVLASDKESQNVLFLATYRDASSTISALLEELDRIQAKTSTSLEIIGLEPLDLESTSMILKDLLSCDDETNKQLSSAIYKQTLGNPFFALQILADFRDKGAIRFNTVQQSWNIDLEAIQVHGSLSLSDAVCSRILRLPHQAKELLKTAACIGSEFHKDIFHHLGYNADQVLSAIDHISGNGLLLMDQFRDVWYFAHDAIREAALELIPLDQRQQFQYHVGLTLWRSLSMRQLDEHIFIVAEQLIAGVSCVKNPNELVAIAKLCMRAAERASEASGFELAYEYLTHGVSLLGDKGWEDQYGLCLELYNASAEMAYCTGRLRDVERLVKVIDRRSANIHDTVRGKGMKVLALGGTGDSVRAVETSLAVLEDLGEKFPSKVSERSVARECKRVFTKLKAKSSRALLHSPSMEEGSKLYVMYILNLTFFYAYLSNPELSTLLGLRMVELSLKNGICSHSAIGFSVMAMVACGLLNVPDEGYRLALLSFSICEKFSARSTQARISTAFYGCVQPWFHPIQESLPGLMSTYKLALYAGDIEAAMSNGNLYCWNQLHVSVLRDLEKDVAKFCDKMTLFGQELQLLMTKSYWQMIHNFMGKSNEDPTILNGSAFDENILEKLESTNQMVYLWAQFHKMILYYMFGMFNEGSQVFMNFIKIKSVYGHFLGSNVLFYGLLSILAIAREDKRKYKRIVVLIGIRKMKSWALRCPYNFLGMRYLLEAEKAVIDNKPARAYLKYTSAIALCRESGFVVLTALSNERLCKHLLERGETKRAKAYFESAVSLYREWGSPVKVQHLKDELNLYFHT